MNIRETDLMPGGLPDSGLVTFSDLFCGIGGFHYAAESLGLQCVFACDIDPAARAQYEHNFGMVPADDIQEVDPAGVPDHDLLCAGFPCQPFSIIGSRRGLQDRRGTLFYEIVRLLKAKRPKAFVLENVRQLATLGGGTIMDEVLSSLSESGYECRWRILNALDYGLPQKRERVIIVGFREAGVMDAFEWPQAQEERRELADVLEANPDRRHYVSRRIRARRRKSHQSEVIPSIWHENKGGNVSSHSFSCALRSGASHNYLLVDGERRLTPREQLRLQGFPESFEVTGNDSQIRRQTGNAVPVPMVRAVINEVHYAVSRRNQASIGLQKTRTISG